MLNFDQTLKATEAAYDSAGITAKQFAVYQDSIEGRLEGLKLQWQSLVAEGGVINNFIKLVIDAGTAVLKFADSDIGSLILKLGALGVAFSFTSWGKDAKAGIQLFTEGLKGAITKAGGLKAILATIPEMLNPAVAAAVLLLGTLAAIAVINYPSTERLNKTLQSNNEKISEYNSKIEELESLERQLEPYEKARLARLKEQTAEIEKQNAKLFEQLQQRALEQTNVTGKSDTIGGGLGFTLERETTLSHTKQNLEEAQSVEDLDEVTKNYIDTVVDLAEQAENSGTALDEQLQSVLDLYNAIPDVSSATEDLGYNTKEMAQNFANMGNSALNSESALNSLSNTLSNESMQLLSNISSVQDLMNAEDKLRNGVKLTETEISNLINKYANLRPYEEAIRNGEISAAEAIHAVGVQSLGTSKTVIANSKAEAEQIVKDARKEVEALAAIAKAQAARHGSMGSFYSNELAEARKNLAAAESALNAYNSAVYYGTKVTVGNTSATSSNTSAKQKQTDTTKKQTDTTKKQTDTTKKQTETTKEQTDATRNLTDALKDQSNALEQAADLMISRLNDEISALEAQKRSIQDANDALEDQIELEEALDALAKAKSRKVLTYSGGQFVYSADASAVGEAQKRVDEIRRQQAQQAQIDAIDKRIDAIKAEQDTWRNVKNAYDEYLGAQQLGVSVEGDAWKKRIGQATEYANQYLKIMQTLAGVESGAISLSSGKTMLASAKTFGKNLKASTAYKTLLETPIQASNLKAQTTGVAQQTVYQYFGDISLPNVTNAEQFVNDLKNFQQFASQSATSR